MVVLFQIAALLALGLTTSSAFSFTKTALTLDEALGSSDAFSVFRAWAAKHGKAYISPQAEQDRFQVWLTNAKHVVQINNTPGRKLKLGLNGLADMSTEEFRAAMLSPLPLAPVEAATERHDLTKRSDKYKNWRYENVKPAKKVDWRTANIIGPIRSQHANNWSCGGCWAFATAGIAEAASAQTTGKLVAASEQQLIDCDRQHDHGCDGGDFHNALDYIIYNKGLTSEDSYPYAGQTNECALKKVKEHQVKIDDWEDVPAFNETALIQAITMRPVVSAICCGTNIDDWHHYDGGVFDVACCHDELALDHAIVLVGYGETDDGEAYYILKNSWSDSWGEKGYMRIARNVAGPPFVSQCGLASMPTMVFRGPKPSAPQQDQGLAGAAKDFLARFGRWITGAPQLL